MRSVVLAYHDIGFVCLEELLRLGEEVPLVVTHGDSPGENVWWRSVRDLARARGVAVVAPPDVNAPEVVARLRDLQPDFLFSFMFRQMLSAELLAIPRLGALNMHPSALPKLRGRSPLNWALVEGEAETGVTLHYMVDKPDRGDIVGQRRFPIGDEDTALTLHRKATEAAREVIREALPLLREGRAPRRAQDQSQATYRGGRRPEDGEIDWRRPARRLYDLVRAVTHPYPGAFTWYGDRKLFVWWARPLADAGGLAPGELRVEAGEVVVGAGDGALRLEQVQADGEDETTAIDWARTAGLRSTQKLGK